MSNATGIDVSDNNGQFDWSAYPDIAFAAAKVGEGPHDGEGFFFDPTFASNWHAMRQLYGNRLVRFAYWFGHPSGDPVEQADALTSIAREHGLQLGDGFWLDLEPYPGLATPDGMPAAEVASWARRFCARVNRNAPRLRCMTYCSPGTAEAGCCAGMDRWRLVVANYGVDRPTVPAPWKTWHIWQENPGTPEQPVDHDVYNGPREQLLDFVRMPADRR